MTHTETFQSITWSLLTLDTQSNDDADGCFEVRREKKGLSTGTTTIRHLEIIHWRTVQARTRAICSPLTTFLIRENHSTKE